MAGEQGRKGEREKRRLALLLVAHRSPADLPFVEQGDKGRTQKAEARGASCALGLSTIFHLSICHSSL
jgi:hypothetical protein